MKSIEYKLKNRRIGARFIPERQQFVIQATKLIDKDEVGGYLNDKPSDTRIIDSKMNTALLVSHLSISVEGAYVVYTALHKLFHDNADEIQELLDNENN